MAIYCRWGEIRIVANLGEHTPPYFKFPATLLKVRWSDSGETQKTFYQWAEFLRSDNGWSEIQAAIEAAPKFDLTAEELSEAFLRAE